jgi:hypothetical protein
MGQDLYYNWNRYYDPYLGRYTTVDPFIEFSRRVMPYPYAQGDPLNRFDRNGLIDVDFKSVDRCNLRQRWDEAIRHAWTLAKKETCRDFFRTWYGANIEELLSYGSPPIVQIADSFPFRGWTSMMGDHITIGCRHFNWGTAALSMERYLVTELAGIIIHELAHSAHYSATMRSLLNGNVPIFMIRFWMGTNQMSVPFDDAERRGYWPHSLAYVAQQTCTGP